ncbi:histidinol-phosphate transaminase [Corynebacterium simulans]|uniref:histidinol-phosphate transaminase n=1 Tax=Corynebacterium simulans TaxID=146827 RepID=UPI00078048E5|nr:histidinol-phosphate transaminase [Corynebacterium simulans]AMO91646.1 histidinol-phosphate transaminase [Corynebacterium simulans]
MIRSDLSSLPVYVPGARNETALKLSSNEATQPPLPEALKAMEAAAGDANRYPDMGVVELRTALAEHLGLTLDEVAVGTGSSAICQQLVQITCQPGDEVVFPWRSFEAYPIFAHVVGATPVPVPLNEEHRVDLPAMAKAVTEKTKVIFVCNPNNPTGSIITRAEFDEFLAAVPDDIIVALDEAYIEYNRNGSLPLATDYVKTHRNVVGLRTFSKAYGLAGVRVGYAFGDKEIIEALNKVAIPFSVNTVAQVGALHSLAAQDSLRERTDETVRQRERVTEHFAKFGVPASEANHIWFPAANITELGTPQEVAAKLAANGVLVRAFDEGVRISITTAEETDVLLKAWEAAFGA